MAWNKPKVTITFSEIVIEPRPEKNIKEYFCIKRLRDKCESKTDDRRIYAPLVKNKDRYGLPYQGNFIVANISPKRVYIKEVNKKETHERLVDKS